MTVWLPVLDFAATLHEYYVKKDASVPLTAGNTEGSVRFNSLYLTNPTTLCFYLLTSPIRATKDGFLRLVSRLRGGSDMLPFFLLTCSVTQLRDLWTRCRASVVISDSDRWPTRDHSCCYASISRSSQRTMSTKA